MLNTPLHPALHPALHQAPHQTSHGALQQPWCAQVPATTALQAEPRRPLAARVGWRWGVFVAALGWCSKWQHKLGTAPSGEPARPGLRSGRRGCRLRPAQWVAVVFLVLAEGRALGTAIAATQATGATSLGTCPGPALHFQPLAPGLWWLPGAPGDSNANNRGHVSNLVLGVQSHRIWLLGSGPTPAFGRALACQVRQRWGRPVTDVISPWPRPEQVLGVAGLGLVSHWGHAEVAVAMQARCARCLRGLQAQLGGAAEDLDLDAQAPVRVPQKLLRGGSGRLGPWRWWRLSRGPGMPVTVWQWANTPVRMAPGLLWGSGVPDARDADVQTLAQATQQLNQLNWAGPQQPRSALPLWLGEQGPPAPDLLARHQQYWAHLLSAVQAAQGRGALETEPAQVPATGQGDDPRHALNWQRAWRQLEAVERQRSLR